MDDFICSSASDSISWKKQIALTFKLLKFNTY